MKVTQQEYSDMTKKASPPTKAWQTIPRAFLCGGLVCVIGQIIITACRKGGLPPEESAAVASLVLILAAALLTGFGVFHTLGKFAGAGLLVPITGFSNSVVSPALEFQSEGFVLGTAAKMFVIAGPVIVYGTAASVVYGLIYWITTIL